MKKLITIIGALMISLILVNFQCNENIVEPPPEPPHPPGYQEDIPWPSLADSPWPMNHHDPQNTGRSNFLGPRLGVLDKIVESPELYSGFAFGEDSTLYFTSSAIPQGGLFAYTLQGEFKWRSHEGGDSYTAPIVSNTGTIYYLGSLALTAINPDGSLKWKYEDYDGQTLKLFTIDKDGNLYFIDGSSHSLKVINKNGEFEWSMTDPQFDYILNISLGNNFVFSPDGKTLYITGVRTATTAIDIENKVIRWEFGGIVGSELNGSVIGSIIDSEGNIYFPYQEIGGDIYFTSLTEDGEQRWKYKLNRSLDEQPTIDKNGNIYFATDTLYSVDYSGSLRWKKALNNFLSTSLVSDNESNIYLSLNGQNLQTMALDSNGNEKWIINDSAYGTLSSGPAIFNNKLFIPSNNSADYYIIK